MTSIPPAGEGERALPETGFVRLRDVLRVYPVSKTTWWRGIQSGRYPKPVKLGARMVAWRAEDIRDLIAKTNAQAAA